MILYFVDNYLHIIYKNKLFSHSLKSLNKGFIINKPLFMEEFIETCKKERIKGKLFGDSIQVVNSFYTNSQQFYLESIFSELGFLKTEFVSVLDYLPVEDATYLEINQTYFVLYLEQPLFFDFNLFLDIPKLLDYFKNVTKDNYILFGNNDIIPDIQIKNKTVYYIDQYKDYILKSLLKVKKCDA